MFSHYGELFVSFLKLGLIATLLLGIVLFFTGHWQRFFSYVYGDFTRNERHKFILYGILYLFIIGIFWLLRCIKNPMFNAFIGARHMWLAKIVSVAVTFPLVVGYSYLVDLFPRHRLFYVMAGIFGGLYAGLWFLIKSPVFGVGAPIDHRWWLLGWFSYVAIESFGSLMVVLFYSLMADTTTPEAGKKGFFVVATFGQIGNMLGSEFVARASHVVGAETIFLLAAGLIVLCIPALVCFINWYIPKEEFAGYQAQGAHTYQEKTGFAEGLKLMLSQPYMMAIFVIVASFEIVATILDLQFQVLIADYANDNADIYASYMGEFGVWVSLLALSSLFLGIGNIGRKVGLAISLALMPLVMVFNNVAMFVAPSLSVVFWIMVFSKGLNYIFGQPVKEQLYIPVSRDAKYKSKAWVDTFGARLSKAFGSSIVGMLFIAGASVVLTVGATLSVCTIWLFVSLYAGKKHKYAVDRNEIVC
ncbi:MAG: Plastidic atp adp transporter [candidate division TM6 bacterium GW2011_GWF2_43_87]|nr:MAG: Plastidic atp adp transporter [candidate division TM6 bacterium GW2011_GWF2_43_87]